jgi:hypothetical protein
LGSGIRKKPIPDPGSRENRENKSQINSLGMKVSCRVSIRLIFYNKKVEMVLNG